MLTDKLFTGQREMAGLGIYHYGARFYSPYINRFLSADTVVPGYANPQALNRYSYVLNNPVKLTDPTGHKCVGKESECEDEDGNPINGVNGPKDVKRDLQRMKSSKKLREFIIYWENAGGGPDQYPYEDMAGICTIGYGHVLPNEEEGCSGWPNKTYRNNPLSLKQAEEWLTKDIWKAENLIKRTIKVDLTQGQFDAMVSYIYNSGDQSNQPFIKKGIPALINAGKFEEAAAAMMSGPITSGGSSSDKLIERRQAEADLFLSGSFGNYVP